MVAKKPALGRGLNALFAQPQKPRIQAESDEAWPPASERRPSAHIQFIPSPGSEPVPAHGLRQIPIEEIRRNPFQPRADFNPEKLAELTASIREKGILQPLIVRGTSGSYQLVAGERRWRAAQQAGLKQVPAIVRDFNDQEMTEAAIIENIQRDDLNPIEEAHGYESLSVQFHETQEEIARKVGKSRAAVTNALRLLKLPVEIIDLIRQNRLSPGQARPLLSLENPEKQVTLARQIVERGLTARDAERLARKPLKASGDAKSSNHKRPSINAADIEERLSLHLGMKVKIHPSTNKKGRVEVFYSSLDEFQKLCEELGLPPSQLM
jgi:ParB family chromosome partitioning protein